MIKTRTAACPLVAVAQEVVASEPRMADRARQGTLAAVQAFCGSAADAGLLHPEVDVEHAAQTTALLTSAEMAVLRGEVLRTNHDYGPWRRRVPRQFAQPEP